MRSSAMPCASPRLLISATATTPSDGTVIKLVETPGIPPS